MANKLNSNLHHLTQDAYGSNQPPQKSSPESSQALHLHNIQIKITDVDGEHTHQSEQESLLPINHLNNSTYINRIESSNNMENNSYDPGKQHKTKLDSHEISHENSNSNSNSATPRSKAKHGENYTYMKNREYIEKNIDKVEKKRSALIAETAGATDKFDHSLPMAGDVLTESRKRNLGYKQNSDGVLNNQTTYYGLESKPGLPWESIRPHLKSFDMIGFHGGDGVSNFIGKVQAKVAGHKSGKRITHVGVIILGEDFPDGHSMHQPGRVYCWESTMSGPLAFDRVKNIDGSRCQFYKLCDACHCPVPSVPHRFGFLGSQFRDMDELTIRYDATKDAKLVWCRLNYENRRAVDEFLKPNLSRGETRGQRLLQMMEDWNGRSYNSTCCCIDLYAAAFPCCRWIQDLYAKCCPVHVGNNGSLFCSEFVANLYQELGLLKETVICKNVVPSDYLTMLNEQNEIVPTDLDGDVPILFSGYVRFTARSKLGRKINLNQWFLDSMRPVPKEFDEEDIKEEHIQQEKEFAVAPISIPIAGGSTINTVDNTPRSDTINCPYPMIMPMPNSMIPNSDTYPVVTQPTGASYPQPFNMPFPNSTNPNNYPQN